MDGSGQQDRKALTTERDLWPIHQGTVQQGTHLSQPLCEHHLTVTSQWCCYTNCYISLPGRSTHLRCTSSRPKITMLETTGVKSPTRTSLTAAPLTWKLKVCQSIKRHHIHCNMSAKYRLAYVLLLSYRSWTGLTEYWYSISFQKKVMKEVWCIYKTCRYCEGVNSINSVCNSPVFSFLSSTEQAKVFIFRE